jgi:N-acetylglucosamine-6-sulfatase
MDFMPNGKALFKNEGITLSEFHPPTNLCCPARASMLTGQFVHNHGVAKNDYKELDPSMTVATQLHGVGYHTVLVGKYLNGYGCLGQNPCPPPLPPGWDRFVAFGSKAEQPYYDFDVWTNGQTKEHFGSAESDYSTDVFARKAAAEIRSAPAGKPLFAIVAPIAPHADRQGRIVPAPRHSQADCPAGKWNPPNWNEEDISDKPEYMRQFERLPGDGTPLLQLCRTMLAVDDLIGQVRDALQETGRLGNTFLMYLGDNGMGMGEHRLLYKGAPYQTRIPAYVRWPGVPPGTISEQLSGADIAPSLCALAGCELGPYPNGQLRPNGQSFLGNLLRAPLTTQRHDLFTEMPEGGTGELNGEIPAWWAVETGLNSRLGLWHYVEYVTGEKELYDLANDKWELENVAGKDEHKDIQAALAARLAQLKAE